MSYLQGYDDEMGEVLADVRKERFRQEDLARRGKFEMTCANPKMTHEERLAVLVEEVGESARAVLQLNTKGSKHDRRVELREELIQVAAVAVAWAEALDAEPGKGGTDE